LNNNINGIGKEYDDDNNLSFESEYLNGKRKGKGKEFYDNVVIFDGIYLNRERNRKGKEFYDDGKLKFDGIYLNGKRNGKGKEFYDDGKLKFDGEYLNDLKCKGKGYNNQGNVIYKLKNSKQFTKEIDW